MAATRTPPTSPADSAAESTGPAPGRRGAILAVVCLSLALVVAGVAMLSVAVPTMTRALGASQADQQWMVDGYTVALAAMLLFAGALGDRFGRKRALLAGLALFVAANAFSAFANSAGALIVWRVLAGVGAALIMPATLSTITSVFPPDKRATAVGVWAGIAGAGGMLGLLLAGAMLEQWWWGSIFVITAALGAVAFVATLVMIPETRASHSVRLDPPGALLSIAAVGGLVFGIIEGPSRGWFDPVTLFGLLGGGLAGVLFVWWELRSPAPLLDPRLFRKHGFATGSASLFLQFFAMFGFFFVGLQYLQLVLGYSTLMSAVALLPAVAVMLPLSTVAASLAERYGQRIVGAGGLLVAAAGFVVLASLQASSGYAQFVVGLVVMVAGASMAMTPATNAILGSLPRAKQGVASAVNDTARELGSAFGIAILGSAFNSGYRGSIAGSLQGLPDSVAAVARSAPAGAFAVAQQQAGAARQSLTSATRDAFMTGSRAAMFIGAAFLLVGAVYVALRGNRATANEPAVDDAHDEADEETLAPALDAALPQGQRR
ncbi:MAG: multidrug transporter [Acidimicrobiales bacterium]|nr:multidrug transporter [Acidimicrobiales bacterium]